MPTEEKICSSLYWDVWNNKDYIPIRNAIFKTYDDKKDYSRTFDDGSFFDGGNVWKVDKLPQDQGEFMSQCVTNADPKVGDLYTDTEDRGRYIIERYQVHLQHHEKKTLGESHAFFKFKTWEEFCTRRF